jgi:hypothetical protein
MSPSDGTENASVETRDSLPLGKVKPRVALPAELRSLAKIPLERLEAVVGATKRNILAFLAVVLPEGYLTTRGGYWIDPEARLKVCVKPGYEGLAFSLDHPKSHYPLPEKFLLTLWMLYLGIGLDDQGICRSKRDLARAVNSLERWNREEDQKRVQPGNSKLARPDEDDPEEVLNAIWNTIFEKDLDPVEASAKELWKAVVAFYGKETLAHLRTFRSFYTLFDVLEEWVEYGPPGGDLAISAYRRSKVTRFRFAPSPSFFAALAAEAASEPT